MRNKYPGTCYVCGKIVSKGQGHFERHRGGWRVQCAEHPIERRKAKQEAELATGRETGPGECVPCEDVHETREDYARRGGTK